MRLIVLSAIFLIPFLASAKVLHYEPDTVRLEGEIERQTFPGRTGYESIKNGDEIESGQYLRLFSPVSVELSKNNTDGNAEAEKNVKIVQLAWDGDHKELDTALLKATGKKVILEGQLFHAFSAHHHARVLMMVDKAEAMSK